MSLQIKPLSEAVAAEISGVELAKITAEEFSRVHTAWVAHKVLLFRNQDLDQAGQLRFAAFFGEVQQVRSAEAIRGDAVMHVSNRPVEGKPGVLPDGEMQFHTDQCYYERPSRLTMLYAMKIPRVGGNTLFLNAAAAFAALPLKTQMEIGRYSVRNIYDYDGAPTVKTGDIREDAPHFDHPLVIRHPDSGQPVLYINRLMSERILELDRAKSDTLLAQLFDHMEQRKFIYEHVWHVGDVVLWDNFAVMHARTDFDPAEQRTLRRVTVQGTRPQPAMAASA